MPSCAVGTCKNCNRSVKAAGKEVIFHCFPKDEIRRKLWYEKCRRLDKINFEYATVCSEHFTDDDYYRDLQSELLGLPLKKKLKDNAVPSLKLCNVSNLKKDVCSLKLHDLNHVKKKRTGFGKKKCDFSPALSSMPVKDQNTTTKDKQSEKDEVLELRKWVHVTLGNATFLEKCTADKQTSTEPCCLLNSARLKKLENQVNYFRSRSQRLDEAVSQLKCRNRQLRETIRDQRNLLNMKKRKIAAHVKKEVHMILRRIFTKKQIQHLLRKSSRTNWDEEDITNAFAIKEISGKCYCYLRNKLGFPLPSLSVLKKWKSKHKSINMELLANSACQYEILEVSV